MFDEGAEPESLHDHLGGRKLGDDWIIDRGVQVELCQKIDDMTKYLEYLISIKP